MGGKVGGNSLGGGVGVEWAFHRMAAVVPPLSHPPPLCQSLFYTANGRTFNP